MCRKSKDNPPWFPFGFDSIKLALTRVNAGTPGTSQALIRVPDGRTGCLGPSIHARWNICIHLVGATPRGCLSSEDYKFPPGIIIFADQLPFGPGVHRDGYVGAHLRVRLLRADK